MDKRWKVYLNLAKKSRNARGTFSWRVWANAKGRWHACGPRLFDVVPVCLPLGHKPSFLAWMGWARRATEAMPLNCLAHCCKALTAALRSAVAWTAFLPMVFWALYNGRMGDCSGRSLIFFVAALFFPSQPYFSRRGLIFSVAALFFPSRPYFSRRGLIFLVAALFFSSQPYFFRRGLIFLVAALFFSSG